MHSYPGCPAKHGWAKCSENPANQKKPEAKCPEAYYVHDKRRPASDAASLSDHRTVQTSDKSSDEYYYSRSDYSDNEDNFAIAISATPCKRAKCKVLPPKKELTIAMSESDDGTNDNVASAKLGKLAASYAVAPSVGEKRRSSKGPKGAQLNPLNLSDSNWLVAPVDASPAYLHSDSCSLNGLIVVNRFDNYSLSRDVPGNAINNNRVTDHLNNDIVDSISVDSNLSVDAYPLIEDEDPPEIETASPAIKIQNKKRLTPTSIMVVDTILTVKSRILLKVLFDPGSTSILISRKCLPRHCKTYPIKQEHKINTLAGSCVTSRRREVS
jgi:hypothetical protein